MQSSPWRIDGHHARLESEHFRAAIDMLDPSGGVKVLAASGEKIDDARLFRIRLPAGNRPEASSVESFTRGDDLIAIHSDRPDNPFRTQIYWRLIRSIPAFQKTAAARSVEALELILSIQTGLLDSDPAVDVETELAAARASQLADAASARFVDRSVTEGGAELGTESGLGCFQFAGAGANTSYVEIIHPADFRRATLATGAAPRRLRLSHRLFAERLEKGVILRSRLRGVFLPANCPPAAIAAAYEEFAASEPPLTV